MIAMFGALALSTILAATAMLPPDATPSVAPTASTSSAVPSAAPTASASADEELIRRGPATTPRMSAPHGSLGDATIANSGSTNSAGYTIVVHPDYSADVTVAGATERKMLSAPQARWLFIKVRAAMPLSSLAAGHCMKSASFGSTTTVAYGGEISPDLSCGGDTMSRELLRTTSIIVEHLQIPLRRTRNIQLR